MAAARTRTEFTEMKTSCFFLRKNHTRRTKVRRTIRICRGDVVYMDC